MIRGKHHRLPMMMISAACALMFSFPVFASEIKGSVDEVDDTQITGWAFDAASPETPVEVELYIHVDGAEEAEKLAVVSAADHRDDLEKLLGNGSHAFTYQVQWNEIKGHSFTVDAYAVSGDEKVLLSNQFKYEKKNSYVQAASKDYDQIGPGAEKAEKEFSEESGVKGESLGMFKTTAYCSCDACSSGENITYSGTVPQPNHTISADINLFPIGTKLMIKDTVYTVEDIGSSVNGRVLDIFYGSHEEALDYGVKEVEVFAVK